MKRFAELAPWILMPFLAVSLCVSSYVDYMQAVSDELQVNAIAALRADVEKLQTEAESARCRCVPEGAEADDRECPICHGTGKLTHEGKEVNCLGCNGTGRCEKFGADGRIIPTVRSLADEAHQATIESRAILSKVDKLLDDIEAGRVGVEIDGSLWKGHAEAKIKRNP